MSPEKNKVKKRRRTNFKVFSKDVVVLRRMRIFRKITRVDAANALERSPKSIERFENGRSTLSIEQKKALVRRYRFTWENFLSYIENGCDLPEQPSRSVYPSKARLRTDGRKYQKIDSKEARVLRILRNMANLTQPEAGAKCGLSRSCIDHIENGRVSPTRDKIEKIVWSYGFKMDQFDELLAAPMLRDDVVKECSEILKQLDNDKLKGVKALLENFR